jgi:peroxiredoxin family protein
VVTKNNNKAQAGKDSLVILVSTDKHLDHVVNLTAAAFAKGKQVSLFFTGRGVLLTVNPRFKQLVGKAELSICDASFRANGLHGREHEVPGVTMNNFATQAENAQMLADGHRHLVF